MNTIALNKTMRHAELDSASPAKREGIAGQARNDGRISLNRLKYLFREYFVLHWKRDLTIIGVLFLVKILFTYMHFPFPDTIIVPITVILCGTFNFWHKKPQGMNYLMIPTNTEEKVIVNILLVHVYYTAILVLSCLLGLFIGGLLFASYKPFIPFFYEIKDINYQFIGGLFMLQSIFIFTSIYFRKNAVLKTLAFFAGLVVILVMLQGGKYIIGANSPMVLIDEQQAKGIMMSYGVYNGVYVTDVLSYTVSKYASHAWAYVAILFFWVLSYFRLRETEV